MSAAAQRHTSLRERVLLDLARRDKSKTKDMFRGITEASALALGVARVGIWRLLPDATGIVCEDSFALDDSNHERGTVLHARDYPAYFKTVLDGRTLRADDARSDPRTSELSERFTSRMDVPIWHRGKLYGVLSNEHEGAPRAWREDEAEFAGNLADIAALTLEASERQRLEDRWASVIDGIPELIVVMDRDGRVVQTNSHTKTLAAQIGTSAMSLEDRKRLVEYRDLNDAVIPHEDWPGPRTLRGEQVRTVMGVWHTDGRFLGYYRVVATPTHEDGQVTGAVGVMTNVTDEIQFERLKAEFLATLAYELKSPVTIVKGNTHFLLRQDGIEPAWRQKLEAIDRASSRMERLIDDVVEISALALGKVTLTRESVDLRGLVEAQIERVERTARGRRFHLIASASAELVVDRARVEKVVRRLLDNAVRYSPQGGDIDVELAIGKDDAVLAVRDRGIGIPADKQPHVFGMFFRAHAGTAHDYGGLGLGLYLSREIAKLHGGELWFESVEGRGSTFYLRLPREV